MSQPSQPLGFEELRAAIEKNEQEKLTLMEQYTTELRRAHSVGGINFTANTQAPGITSAALLRSITNDSLHGRIPPLVRNH